MRKSRILIYSFAFVLSACNQNGKEKQPVSSDGDFQQLSESFLKGYLDWRPQYGVTLGFHEYDGKLTDMSKESIGPGTGAAERI